MQTLKKSAIIAEVIDLAPLKQKGVIQVLHVDDDLSFLEISEQIMRDMGNFKVENACCADEALKKLSSGNYDIVISDYEMPQKNGLQLLRELREQKNEIPFILFTGRGREEIAVQALNLGADGYINKLGNTETVYAELAHCIQQVVKQKRAEKELLESQYLNAKILSSTPNLIYVFDIIENRNIYANKEVVDFLGYSPDQVKAMGSELFATVLHPDDVQAVVKHHSRFVNAPDNAVYEIEYRMKHASGDWCWLRSCDVLFSRTDEGKGKQILGSCEDITALKESESKYRNIFNNSEVGMFRTILDGSEILDCNDKFLSIFGFRREEMKGKPSVIHWADPIERQKMVAMLKAKGYVNDFECKMVNKQGEIKSCLTSVKIYRENGTMEGTIIDITERKTTEKALQESEEKFRNLAEESPNAIFINKRGRVIYANKKSEEITGYDRDEIYSSNFNFLSLCAPEYVELMSSSYAKHMKGEEVSPYDYVLLAKDGKRIDVVTTSKLIDYDGGKAILGIVTDISELKRAEETLNRTMNELVTVNEKLGVVGSLTRHDVRNKLSVINGNIFLLKKKYSNCSDMMDRLVVMEQACRNIVEIFDFAKMYEQLGVEELSYVNVGKAVDEAVALLSGPSNVKVINECHGLTVLADSFLRQLYYNLIDNSVKHGERVTKIRVQYRKADEDKLNLIYEDDGIGVSIQNKPLLFKEGFSTRGSSGYGLYLIRKMIEVYGWAIQENGEPDKGAQFTITIPKISQNGKENFRITDERA